jgi:hypothetical protein
LLGAGLGEAGRDLAVHLFQLVGAAGGGLQAGLQGQISARPDSTWASRPRMVRALSAWTVVRAFSAARTRERSAASWASSSVSMRDRRATSGRPGRGASSGSRLFDLQGVVLVGAGQGGLGLAATGVDVLGLDAQGLDVLHQVFDARRWSRAGGVQAADLEVGLQQAVAQAVDLEGVVLEGDVLGLAAGVGFAEGGVGGGQLGGQVAFLGLGEGDLARGLVVGGAQGDQLGVLGATGFEFLGDRTADLGEQRLDGAQVLDDAADAVEAAMDGLVADADGLGGFDQTVGIAFRDDRSRRPA